MRVVLILMLGMLAVSPVAFGAAPGAGNPAAAPANPPAASFWPGLFDSLSLSQKREPSFGSALSSFSAEIDRLGRIIEDRRKQLDTISATTLDQALQEARKLRQSIDGAMSPLRRDGDLAQSVNRVIEWATDKRQAVLDDPRLSAEQKQKLVGDWDVIYRSLAADRDELLHISSELLTLLQSVSSSEAFMAHLILVDQGQNAVTILRSLIHDLEGSAGTLRTRVHAIKPAPMM